MIKSLSESDSSVSVNCLLAALKEAQDSVRSYDSKAQIVGVGFIFTIGIITKLGAALPGSSDLNTLGVILFWLLGIVPILLFGFVLYPSRNSVPCLQSCKEKVHHKFYISSERPPQTSADATTRSNHLSFREAIGFVRPDPIAEQARIRRIGRVQVRVAKDHRSR